MSTAELALLVVVGAVLMSSLSGGGSSDGPSDGSGMTANEKTAYWINQRHEQQVLNGH